jgi:hypothetical protein
MPSSSSSPAALHGARIARIPSSIRSIPASETTSHPPARPPHSSRAATRRPHAQHPSPDVAAANPSLQHRPPPPPRHHSPATPPARSASPTFSARREQRPRTALPTIDKVDSKPKSIAGTVKSRAHSRLVSFGRIRPRGLQLPADRDTLDPEPLSPIEPVPALPRPSIAGSHKRSEPSTASYQSSETTLSDEKYHDTKSFEESRQQPIARGTQRNSSVEQRGKLDEYPVDPTEQYHRLVASRSRMMHQTSSRLLRMTEDDRPFTRVSDTFPCTRAQVPAVRISLLHLRNVGATENMKVSAAIAHPRLCRLACLASSFQCLLFSAGTARPGLHSPHRFQFNI